MSSPRCPLRHWSQPLRSSGLLDDLLAFAPSRPGISQPPIHYSFQQWLQSTSRKFRSTRSGLSNPAIFSIVLSRLIKSSHLSMI
ncbi:hypothetical protein PGT21_001767 [Puccinia graminis f. sp. tritici]|uniref:Uncharacterized protein n=1 Tax=Puccinia graminis f. sp. tritici TaxID=56615 RepID=A0A5B0P3G4_PUCGR|nr:hypothetical protein PGT21_001767 [Puccinia graminis f. sp. tritici]KAA1137207.1 hypothetical protein PGTUg99_015422 [Puccinia graminis f. sp. tritici]